MVNTKSFITALKSTWIRRIYGQDGNWTYVVDNIFKKELLANCRTGLIKKKSEECKNVFWRYVLQSWYTTITTEKISKANILENPVWFNEEIKIGGRTVFYDDWYKKGVHFIYNFLKNNGVYTVTMNSKLNIM